MTLLQKSSQLARRWLRTSSNPPAWRALASSAHLSAPEKGADANRFDLGDTGGVPKEEFADTYPDAYIMKVFQHQQQSYRRYLDGIKGIEIPQDPDTKEFSNYVSEMEKLKAQSGLPTAMDLSGAQMVTLASESNNSFRRFLELVTEGADLSNAQEGWDAIWQALEEVESSEGPVPLAGNNKAAQAFSQKMKGITSKLEKELGPSLSNEVVESYRNQLKQFRESQESPELTEALEAGIAGNAQADVSGSIEDAPSKP